MRGEVVHPGRPVVVLALAGAVAPAPGAGRRRQMIAARSGEPLGIGVVEDQAVQRQVIGPEGERPFQALRPGRQRLARDVVQQVEVDGADPRRAGRRDGVADVRRGVTPAELAELAGMEALCSE
jgi:hypothetical protein